MPQKLLIIIVSLGVLLLNYGGILILRELLNKSKIIKRHNFPLLRALLGSSFIIVPTVLHFTFQEKLNNIFDWSLFLRLSVVAGSSFMAWSLSRIIFQRIYLKFDLRKEDNLRSRKIHTQLQYIERISNITIGFFALIALLFTFEDWYEFGVSLLTSAGVVSVIVGLASQKYLSNLISGFQIAFTQPIRIDDAVVVENEWGWIEEITLTYVVIRVWDLRRLVVPISYFTDKPFQNWTRTTAEIIGTVNIKIDYLADIDPIRDELDKILEETDLWNRNVKVVQLTECDDHSLTIRILVSASNSPRCWDLRCFVREKLIDFLKKQGHYIPQQRLQIKKDGKE